MIRFASAIRFVAPHEWESLPREGMHTVMSWAMQGNDQWVPSTRTETKNMAPCIASAISRIVQTVAPNGDSTPRGMAALSHLAPIFHKYRDDTPMLLGYLKPVPSKLAEAQSADPLLKQASKKAKVKGFMVGGYAPLENERVWQALFYGMNEAVKTNTLGEQLQHALGKRLRQWGWRMPTPWPLSRNVSAFVGQEDYGSSNVHYDGVKDTWYVLAYRKPSMDCRMPHVASLQDILDHFQYRQVATDDQVYIGLNSTTPIPHKDIEKAVKP